MCLHCQRRFQHHAAAELPVDTEETKVPNRNVHRGRETRHPPRAPRTYIVREDSQREREQAQQLGFMKATRSRLTLPDRSNADRRVSENRYEAPPIAKTDIKRVAEVRRHCYWSDN
jgi:hypothetical protein